MGIAIRLEVGVKPSNTVSICDGCRKGMIKGESRICFIASGHQSSGSLRFHVPCFFRWLAKGFERVNMSDELTNIDFKSIVENLIPEEVMENIVKEIDEE